MNRRDVDDLAPAACGLPPLHEMPRATGDYHVHTLRGERLRDRLSYAGVPTRYDRRFIL
jgi:hypothetical protein